MLAMLSVQGRHLTTKRSFHLVRSTVRRVLYSRYSSESSHPGYRMSPSPNALLQRWYALVREKRATRQDFLKALVKVFDVEVPSKSSQVTRPLPVPGSHIYWISLQDDVEFIRYMAENFSAFDYKTQEEVLTVLKYLTAVLSTTGMQLVEALSPFHLLSQLHGPPQAQSMQNGHLSGLPVENSTVTQNGAPSLSSPLSSPPQGMMNISLARCAD